MKKTKYLVVLMLALVLVLAACGGGDKTSSTPASSEPASSDAASTPESTEASAGESSEVAESSDVVEASIDPADQIEKMTDANTLVVAGAELNGDYINGFGNSSYDVWIKNLIGNYGGSLGYATIYSNEGGELKYNPTVNAADPEVKTNEDGSKTYTFKIKDNLVWNDGTPITAKDYVFGVLFANMPEWTTAGADNGTSGLELKGYKAYHDGETLTHAGLALVDDHTFSVTIDKAYVPYYYETALVGTSPTPRHRYAPNLDIVAGENGAATLAVKEGYQISDEDKKTLIDNETKKVAALEAAYKADYDYYVGAGEEEPGFNQADYDALVAGDYAKVYEEQTKEYKEGETKPEPISADHLYLLQQLIAVDAEKKTLAGYQDGSIELDAISLLKTAAALEVSQTYRYNPDVTSGPYNFVSFGNNMAKVTLNDKFVGDANGKKPTIQNVIVQTVNNKVATDFVIAGTIDINPGVIEGAMIEKAKASPDAGFTHYYRNGYGVMPILNDIGATQYVGVRRAIGFLLDRAAFVNSIAEGYGSVVSGAYGLAQFEYAERGFDLENSDGWTTYTLNVTEANKALDDTPYKFEADGTTPWDAAKAQEAYNKDKEGFNYWRYDEKGEAGGGRLRVIHQGSEGLDTTILISTQLPDNAKQAGMQYIVQQVDFATLLKSYYTPDAKNKDAATVFNMGTNFGVPNDPFYSYHSSQIGAQNKERVNDPELDKILETMRVAEAGTEEGKKVWLDGWVQFQKWFNANLPQLPLYGNDYHDIFNKRVKGLETTPMWDWSYDIADITLEN